LHYNRKQNLKSDAQKLLENKQRVPSTIKELQTERDQEFLCSYSDVANYNMYGDEDLFCMKRFRSSLQISLQQENKSLPDFRKFNWFGAYGEGWALYTESLGKELGLYQDPYQYFGMLGNEMHRAVRLVVDTLHAKGWTRESYPVFFSQ
jgi:hypothetical protein